VNVNILEQLQVFNLPRKDWICENGWKGLDDERFTAFRDTLLITEVSIETSVQNKSGITTSGAPHRKSRQVTFFHLNALSPKELSKGAPATAGVISFHPG